MVTSCQVTGIDKGMWMLFRQQCIKEGLSANQKLKMLIEEAVNRYSREGKIEGQGRCDDGMDRLPSKEEVE